MSIFFRPPPPQGRFAPVSPPFKRKAAETKGWRRISSCNDARFSVVCARNSTVRRISSCHDGGFSVVCARNSTVCAKNFANSGVGRRAGGGNNDVFCANNTVAAKNNTVYGSSTGRNAADNTVAAKNNTVSATNNTVGGGNGKKTLDSRSTDCGSGGGGLREWRRGAAGMAASATVARGLFAIVYKKVVYTIRPFPPRASAIADAATVHFPAPAAAQRRRASRAGGGGAVVARA